MSRSTGLLLLACLIVSCDPAAVSSTGSGDSTVSAPANAASSSSATPVTNDSTTSPPAKIPEDDRSRVEGGTLEETVASTQGRLELRADERVFDWGTAYQGQTFSHTFRLRNSGQGEILVKEVKTQCGCTTSAPIENRRVSVGEWLDVPVTIDTAKFETYTQKEVDVICDGEVTGDLKLFLQGDVSKVLVVEPESPRLELVRDPDSVSSSQTEIELSIGIDRPVEVRSVTAEKSLVETALEVEEAGSIYRVRCKPRLSDDDMKVALHNETLLVNAVIDEKEISLPVSLTIKVVDRITVTPARSIWFPRADTAGLEKAAEGAKGPTRTLEILSLGGPQHRFQIRAVEAENDAYATTLETVEAGRHYRLIVELRPPADRAARMQRASVTVRTDDPVVGDILIPGTAQY